MKTEKIRKLWDKLPFDGIYKGFPEEFRQKRREEWYKAAERVLRKISYANCALNARGAAGKTIISLLVGMLFKKVLFVLPTRILSRQQMFDTGRMLFGSTDGMIRITGQTAAQKRQWPEEVKFFFCTPQVVINDSGRGAIDLNSFDLAIIDEYHFAREEHAMAQLGRLLKENGVRMICLSATPPDNREEREKLNRVFALRETVKVEIITPDCFESILTIPLTPALEKLEPMFLRLLKTEDLEILKSLPRWKKSEDELLTRKELNFISKEILPRYANDESPLYFEASHAFAYYGKMLHAYEVCFQEGYGEFLSYIDTLERQQENPKEFTKANKRILKDKTFHEIQSIVREELRETYHPKFLKLEDDLATWVSCGYTTIVFVKQVETAEWFKKHFEGYYGAKTAILKGGLITKAEIGEQDEIITKLAAGEINLVFATSVVEAGLNIPKIDVVIHYMMPETKASRKQRNGRAGRHYDPGYVHYLCLEHFLDKKFLWTTNPKPRKKKPKKNLSQLEFDFVF